MEGGVFLPDALADAVMQRLLFADEYPGLCQAALDNVTAVQMELMGNALASQRARYQAKLLEREATAPAPGWRWWEVAGVAIGAVAVGLATGYAAGALSK